MHPFFANDQTVLFMGDSITDWGRQPGDTTSLGTGYPAKIAAAHQILYPDLAVKFFNLGVSGARISDLITISMPKMLELKPDFISILVGINDVWRRFDSGNPRTATEFQELYEKLMQTIKLRLRETKILLIEPFLFDMLPTSAMR